MSSKSRIASGTRTGESDGRRRGEPLEEAEHERSRGDGLGGVEAKVKMNESLAQSGGSMSAKNCGAGVGV